MYIEQKILKSQNHEKCRKLACEMLQKYPSLKVCSPHANFGKMLLHQNPLTCHQTPGHAPVPLAEHPNPTSKLIYCHGIRRIHSCHICLICTICFIDIIICPNNLLTENHMPLQCKNTILFLHSIDCQNHCL